MRIRHAAMVAGLALGLMSGAAKAAYVFDITQDGSNVVVTGSGSIDITAATFGFTLPFPALIDPSSSVNVTGTGSGSLYFIPIIGPYVFGTGGSRYADSSSGPLVAIDNDSPDNSSVTVPENYITGTPLGTSTATYDNTTLASFGLTPGTSFTYLIPTQGAESFPDTLTINVVGMSPVPLPASAPMFGAALLALGAVGYGVKRKKAAAAA